MPAPSHISVGQLGEAIAAHFLKRRGLQIVERNAFVQRDEIDIIYRLGGSFVAVEVKTSTTGFDPLDAFTEHKMMKVSRAMRGHRLPIFSLDAIAVEIDGTGVVIRWLRGVS